MNKVLTICPSRNRPDRIQTMLESYDRTKSEGNDLVIYVSEDDPKLEEYQRILGGRNLIIGKRVYIVEANNICFQKYPDYDYYAEVNDDHIYHTPYWDKLLIETIENNGGWGIASGRDILHDKDWQEHRLPSACMISGNIPRTLGFIINPIFKHTYIDNVLRDLGEGCNMLFFRRDVIIEHNHYLGGKVPIDDNYRWVISGEAMEQGRQAYKEWCEKYRTEEIRKINESRSNSKVLSPNSLS